MSIHGGADFLEHMVERRRADVAVAYGALGAADRERLAAATRTPRDLTGALLAGASVAVIAEVKKASPSCGPIAPDIDAAAQAMRYRSGGAAAVSVLTEPSVFAGSFDDLARVSAAVDVPVLCKDFVVDEVQLFVARASGADAVLLMVSVLGAGIAPYLALARRLGMQALVEVISRDELDIALASGATLVGVNARNLHSLAMDALTAQTLVAQAKTFGMTAVLASGVRSRADVEAAAAAGADAVLVGETLMRASDPAAAVADLSAVARVRAGGQVRP